MSRNPVTIGTIATMLFALGVACGGGGRTNPGAPSNTPSCTVITPVGEIDPNLVGLWRGVFAGDNMTMTLTASGGLDMVGTFHLQPLHGTWRASGTVFTAQGQAITTGIVSFTMNITGDTMSGSWCEATGRSGPISMTRQ